MIPSTGENRFPDNCFKFWDWSAPVLQTADEVIQGFHELRLAGRVIKDIRAVGMGYTWHENAIDDAVYNALERMNPGERAEIPNSDSFLPQGLCLNCQTDLDEPLLILFEDGEVLAISFDEGSCVRMALNTIPVDIEPGINPRTFHANRLFRKALGMKIRSLTVCTSTEMPNFTGSHGLTLGEQSAYVIRLEFVLSNEQSKTLRLCFEAWFDYGYVELTNQWGETLPVPSSEVPWIVEGYLDPKLFT